jgi:hypothetical protein
MLRLPHTLSFVFFSLDFVGAFKVGIPSVWGVSDTLVQILRPDNMEQLVIV